MCLVFTTFRPYHKNFSRFYSLASQFSVARFRHTIPFLSFFQCNQLCCKFSPVKIISYNKSWQFDNRYRFLSLRIYFFRNFYSDIKTFIIFRDELYVFESCPWEKTLLIGIMIQVEFGYLSHRIKTKRPEKFSPFSCKNKIIMDGMFNFILR